jgi:TonB family protein
VPGLSAAEPPDLLRWLHYEEPAFPPLLFSTMVREGFVNVIFTFDASGRITDRIATAASHPAFVVSVYEAMQHWEVDTLALAAPRFRESIRFDFERRVSIVTMTQRDVMKAAFTPYMDQPGTALFTVREEELTVPLETTVATVPTYPPALSGRSLRGVATISFVVDTEGRVRVAAITDATEREFGEATRVAVNTWRFVPPRHLGVPVLVMAERTFRFGAAPSKPAER